MTAGLTSALLLFLLSVGNAWAVGDCNPRPFADTSRIAEYAADEGLPFRFPMDALFERSHPYPARFCEGGGTVEDREFHAAEDYYQPAGTPVVAIADGRVSFSGRMGGYGWLVIVDHPQLDLYSLYGHLSPRRWHVDTGTAVEKGQMLGHLGDEDENGGSAEHPLPTHLHFAVRVGQRGDYPGKGEWRWQAGWIKPCPADLGWLHPSELIDAQGVPEGGFPAPHGSLWEVWRAEIVITGVYVISGFVWLFFGIRQRKRVLLVLSCSALVAVGWFFHIRGMRAGGVILAYALLHATVVGVWLARQRRGA